MNMSEGAAEVYAAALLGYHSMKASFPESVFSDPANFESLMLAMFGAGAEWSAKQIEGKIHERQA